MDFRQECTRIARTASAEFVTLDDGTMKLETVVAERKSILSRKKLTYVCRIRVDDRTRAIRFFEKLTEVGFGLSAGGTDDGLSPGLAIKREVSVVSGKERRGILREWSRLWGSDYAYRFDPGKFRDMLRQAATDAGYAFEVTLLEKSV